MKGHEALNLSQESLKVVKGIPSLSLPTENRVQTYIDRIKRPLNGHRIQKAVETERRIRLHTVGTQDSSTSFEEWKADKRKLLPADKFDIFCKLIGEPVPTLTLSETIFDELAKIFEASNSSQKLTFDNESSKKADELKNYFDADRFFKEDVWEQLKIAPNSFVVIDIRDGDVGGRPSPVPYFVHIDSVIDASVNRDGSTNYLLFRAENNAIVGIDDEAYYVFDTIDGNITIREGYPSYHNLTDRLNRPYTPAFLIYPNFLNATDSIMVNSPLTKNLGAMEWLLFWSVSKRYLDIYAPFPIYVSYEQDCSYESGGFHCENGRLVSSTEGTDGGLCPKCSKTKMFGAGTEITVPAPQTREEPNLIEAVKVIPAEKNSIDYVTKEKVRLEQEIYYSILGKTSSPIETFSQSVSQLDLSIESRKAVLLQMKRLFERVHEKVIYTIAKLRYGDEFVDAYVNYGDNYFLTTAEQETKNYQSLKNAGAPEGLLHANLERIISTTYKTSPFTALLNLVYLEVEPYQTMSVDSVVKLYGAGMIPKDKALAKIHFTDFIEEFEAEHGALIKLIQLGEYDKDKAVKQIKKQLDVYVSKIANQVKEELAEKEVGELEKNRDTTKIPKPSSIEKRKYEQKDDQII